MSSVSKDTDPLLFEMSANAMEWSKQEAVQEMKSSDPERWERSRQFVLGMKQFENLIKRKVAKNEMRATLDLEILICLYNLLLSISQ